MKIFVAKEEGFDRFTLSERKTDTSTTNTTNTMKTIQVFHTAFHHHNALPSQPLATETYTVDPARPSDEEVLESIFAVTNGQTFDEDIIKLVNKSGRCYSTSVGDVMVIQDGASVTNIRYYIVAPIGFKKLNPTMFHACLYQYTNDETIDPRGFWDDIARNA